MKAKELNNKTAAELRTMTAEANAKLMQLRFDLADKKVQNTAQIRALRRDIARMETALRVAAK